MVTRVYDFTNLTVRLGAKVDDELNNIINFLKGSTADQLYIKYSDSSASPLTVGNLSSNPSIEWALSGTTKDSIDKNGSLTNVLSTGTAPFTVASTTKCTGLNVGYLDDIITTAFNSNVLEDQFHTGNIQITKLSTGTQSVKAVMDADDFSLQRTSDSANILQITEIESNELITISLPSTLNVRYGYEKEDTDYFDPLILSDLKEIEELNAVSFTRNGNLSVNDFLGVYVCPCPVDGIIKLKQANVVLYAGATTAQTITFYKNGVSIGVANTTTLNAVVGIPFNVALSEDDTIYIKVTTATPGTVSFGIQLLLTW